MKTGRNNLCWCGSGKKFKYCHLRREYDAPLGHQDIIDRTRIPSAGHACLHPEAPNKCSGTAIQSHSIARSGSLSKIAEDDHVMTLYADYGVFMRTDGNIEPRRMSVRKASAFPAFCSFHDAFTFRPIEKAVYYPNEKNAFLVGYRALCREIFFVQASADHGVLAEMDRGMPAVLQRTIQQLAVEKRVEAELKLQGLRLLKQDYDAALLGEDFGGMSYYSVEFADIPDVMVSSLYAPFVDFQGKIIRHRDVLGTKDDHLTVSLFASGSRGWFQLAWLGESDAGMRFTESFGALSDEQIPHAIVRFVFSSFENRYFRPSWWIGLLAADKEALCQRFWNPQNPFSARPSTHLEDDGRRLVHWQVKSRSLNIKGGRD